LAREKEQTVETPGLVIPFAIGDRVKVKDGMFANQEGEVDKIDTKKGLVTVLINTMGRTMPFEIEYLQIEKI
jgi:transcriptional antiterminator NusG